MFCALIYLIIGLASAANLCPNGWIFSTQTSYCYYISNLTMTWDQASTYCDGIGGTFLTINTYTEYTYLKNFTATSMLQPWLGYHRNLTTGKFYDLSGSQAWAYWGTNEPSINGDCVSFRGNDGMQATPCYNIQPVSCKQQPSLCPNQTQYGGSYTRSGTITSPGYPEAYYNNLDCLYTITSPNGTFITITFSPYEVESIYDYISIYDGPNATNYLGQPYTYGRNYYESSSNVIFFKFHTDSLIVKKGWMATWAAKPNTPPIRQNGTNGTLTSDNYPSNYNSYTEQLYYISVDYGFQINLTITDFVTEANYDILQVYNSSVVSNSYLIANLSGSSVAPWNILSPSNYLTLKFTSDSMVQKKGWSLYWFIQ
ncbi:unnamed protein product [Caenorhabditis angaria]|uniref:CUB domain-containing protein n=1 Tax=Caenorhabditis angaria TaxID=860376 RepID=A0A9P1IWQ4_9PELO|nr:unnamed protein product [Caenorhabditis angaria]